MSCHVNSFAANFSTRPGGKKRLKFCPLHMFSNQKDMEYPLLGLHIGAVKDFLRVASQAFLCVSEIDQKSVIKAMTNL